MRTCSNPDAPAGLLASLGVGGRCPGVQAGYGRIAGERGRVECMEGLAHWDLRSIPKPRRDSGRTVLPRPLCNSVTVFIQHGRLLCAAASRSSRLVVAQHFDSTPATNPWASEEYAPEGP